MPICQIKTNYNMSCEIKKVFADKIAENVSGILEKPIQAVMVMISDEYMYMNKCDDTVVFAEFRYVRNFESPQEKEYFLKEFSNKMLKIFMEFMSVDPYRVYMQFTEMPRDGAWHYVK